MSILTRSINFILISIIGSELLVELLTEKASLPRHVMSPIFNLSMKSIVVTLSSMSFARREEEKVSAFSCKFWFYLNVIVKIYVFLGKIIPINRIYGRLLHI